MCQSCGGRYEDNDEVVQEGWIGCDWVIVAGGTTTPVQDFLGNLDQILSLCVRSASEPDPRILQS